MEIALLKGSKVKWTDELFAVGLTIWEHPYQIDINLGFFRITIGGEK